MGMTIARRLANAIINGFDAFFGDFQNLTLGAQARFENADWQAVHDQMRVRLEVYKKKVKNVANVAEEVSGAMLHDRALWRDAKVEYSVLVESHNNFEIAQTFFNSVYCFVFEHEKIHDLHSFIDVPDFVPTWMSEENIYKEYGLNNNLEEVIGKILSDAEFTLPFEDVAQDIVRSAELINMTVMPGLVACQSICIQVLESLFYRNKAAYIVGRIVAGDKMLPIVFPILNDENGSLFIDTVLILPDEVSLIFSFTRSYFMVDASIPSQYVAFLKTIMPNKELFELYSALGFGKHGKTVFYRCAVTHMITSQDKYIIAPGIKGMVMLVFTLPSYDYVFKVIKDRFTPPKDMTRAQVKGKYKLVKRWDRAGRMADTQEFTNLVFDRRRFSDELIAEFNKEIPSLVEVKSNVLVLKHVYVERRMTPLNLYLKDATDEQIYSVMDEYGNAIKQLAGANIFPGDMLLKNFGVTRHGRVVFYDYDEICPLVDCNFRRIPQASTPEQEMASQPWFDVAEADIFPQEFRLFFSGNRRAREVFDQLHPDIYEVEFWQDLQQKIRDGKFADVYPYRRKFRFDRPDI